MRLHHFLIFSRTCRSGAQTLLVGALTGGLIFGAAWTNAVTLTDQTGLGQNARPTTISRVFKQGEITGYPRPSVAGTSLPSWQSNVMNRWPDGSVKHALISFNLTIAQSAWATVLFVSDPNPCHLGNQSVCDAAAPTQAEILGFNNGRWGASINVTASGIAQSASARAMVSAGAWRFWIKGPLCNQIIVEDRSPALSFDFGFKNKRYLTGDYHTPYVQPTDTTIPVLDATDLAALSLPTTILWDSEQISICSVTGNVLNVCPSGRGYNSTMAAAHATYRSDVSSINILAYPDPTWIAATTFAYKSLHPIVVLTLYTGWTGVKEEFILENVWITKLQGQTYDILLQSGLSSGVTQFAKSGYMHYAGSRWRETFWDGSVPGGVNVDYNLPYMEASKALQNMDTSLVVPHSVISAQVNAFGATDQGALGGYGQWQRYFPEVGGRPDIGQIPTWTAQYLFSFDPALQEVELGNAAAGAYIPVHYRESDTSRWFDSNHTVNAFARPVSVERSISFSNFGLSGGPYLYSDNPTFVGSNPPDPWSPDLAHQADFAYVPYLISGDWFWLEEMYFWDSYNTAYPPAGTTDYLGRHGNWGFLPFSVETRGQAWAFRNLSNAWFMSPDGVNPEKDYVLEKINNNIQIREGQYNIVNGAFPPADSTCAGYVESATTDKWCWGLKTINSGITNNPLKFVSSPIINQDPNDMDPNRECEQDSPWMINLNHMVWGYMEDLGLTQIHAMRYDRGQNLLGQLLDPGYAISGAAGWLADSYRYGVLDNPSGSAAGCSSSDQGLKFFTTWSQAKSSQLPSVVSTYGASQWASSAAQPEFGYANIARAAASYLSGLTGAYNGQTAWNWILANTNNISALSSNPRWALLPRAPALSRCDLNQDGLLSAADVAIAVQQVLNPASCKTADLNRDNTCNVLDVQLLVNAVSAQSCPPTHN